MKQGFCGHKFQRMNSISYLLLVISSVFTEGSIDFSMSQFYEDTYSHEYNCSVHFDQPMFFDCACVTGLWILYESCSENFTITGDDTPRCIRLTGAPIAKAIQVVRNREELGVVTPNGKVALLKPQTDIDIDIYKDWALITGSDWTLIDESGTRVCLSVIEPDAYCFFANTDSSQLEIKAVEKGCNTFDYFLDPQKCEPVAGEYENICQFRPTKHKIVKRQEDGSSATTDAPASSGNSSNSDPSAITEDDEDYIISQEKANSTSQNGTDPTIIIADALLDFMSTILDYLLGFHENPPVGDTPTAAPAAAVDTNLNSIPRVQKPGPTRTKKSVIATKKATVSTAVIPEEDLTSSSNPNPLNVSYSNPAYEFLEISKRITQKTCPSFYVKPRFLNLAVATFIRLQQVQFKFPETSFKPAGFRRVLEYLRKCEQFASKFNFTDADCDGKVDGNYTAFGQTIELTVTAEYANFNRDPIIETVWKIFFNAHSYCYPFFNKTLDHHRFTTWMIPLFQNQINDIWTAGKTTENSLNGLFGNQIQVQGNLAYCAVSSRLESTYPFDLPRPTRVPEYGPSLIGPGGTNNAANTTRRRRRDVDFINYLNPIRSGNCLDTSKPMLCPDHVKSIVSQ